jgi:hypothetical protein
MKIVLTPFMILAGIGLILSIIVHLLALLGMPNPFGQAAMLLHIGIFVVWLPAVIVGNKLVKDFKRKDFWEAALRACPKWMKYMTSFFFGYAILNFIIFIILGDGNGGSSENPSPNTLRGFSGHWMAFYSVALAMLYSGIHIEEHDNTRRCPNRHPVSPSAKFCEECGEKIIEQENYNPFINIHKN